MKFKKIIGKNIDVRSEIEILNQQLLKFESKEYLQRYFEIQEELNFKILENSDLEMQEKLSLEFEINMKALIQCEIEHNKIRVEAVKPISSSPPKTAEYLIYLLIPKKNREVMLGDLEEDFYIVCEKFGPLKAKFHYWFQVLRSIPPLIGASALKILMASITKAFRTTN